MRVVGALAFFEGYMYRLGLSIVSFYRGSLLGIGSVKCDDDDVEYDSEIVIALLYSRVSLHLSPRYAGKDYSNALTPGFRRFNHVNRVSVVCDSFSYLSRWQWS